MNPLGTHPLRVAYDYAVVGLAVALVTLGFLEWFNELPDLRLLVLVALAAVPVLVRHSLPVAASSYSATIGLAPAVLYAGDFDRASHVFPLWAVILAVSYPFFQGDPLKGAPRTAIQVIAGYTLVQVCAVVDVGPPPYDRALAGLGAYFLVVIVLDLPRNNPDAEGRRDNDLDLKNVLFAVVALLYAACLLGTLRLLADGPDTTPRLGAAILLSILLIWLTILIARLDTATLSVATLTRAATAMPWPNGRIDATLLSAAESGARARRARFSRAPGPRGSLSLPMSDGRYLVLRRGRGDLSFRKGEEELARSLVAMAEASRHQAAHEQRLQHAAKTDDLTGLWRVPHFTVTVEDTLAKLAPGQRIAVFFIDVDGFNRINEQLGHLNADLVMRQLGQRLLTALPAGTTPARFGGDEFLVLMKDAHSAAHVESTRHRIATALHQPMTVDSWVLQVDATIGVAISHEGSDHDSLIGEAERDMRRRQSRAREDTQPRWAGELDLIGDLVDEGGISVAYQPIVDLHTGELFGYEALIRGSHPRFGQLSPLQIIGSAMRLGILDEITEIVAEQAITTVGQVAESLGRRLALSLNIEFQQLYDGNPMLQWLRTRHLEAPIDLILELSERQIGAWHSMHNALAESLRGGGIEMAIDDFGAGHASFAIVSEWDWKWVKLDRSFLTRMGQRGSVMLPHVARMLADLGTTTVIEGIETRPQLELAHQLGIPLGQGLRFGAPQSAAEIAERPEVHGLGAKDLLMALSSRSESGPLHRP
ncbi:bifunctional diguanylate cyclase/phosphodiesterase [Nocardioides dubius]|uniref:Diguanylate cyclase (GGDEF) domain-containing protein n=1 Tax=Nocardioides dubius TaxID=317019 RepID=A0ABN1TWR5_9ACTN